MDEHVDDNRDGHRGDGWDVREAGPADAPHRVMMLPGGMCSAVWYEDVMAEPALASSGVGLTAVTQPGFGGTTPPEDLTMDNYARLIAGFAAERGCDVLVGHSLGANVVLETAAAGLFSGPLVLLSPTFSRRDEAKFLTVMDHLGQVPGLGALAWAGMMKSMPTAMKHSLPPARAEALSADVGTTDPAFARHVVRRYYEYLDRYGSLVDRLCATGLPTWVVRGDHDEIGLQPAEREALEACPQVTMVTVPDAGHLVLVEQPAAVAEVILSAVASL
ncbi:alpha/beta fold hydrolase [Kitasatospora sp. NPDC048194]|uniref:alpha/beta fold hydrolase n=1 Tax=Kitasatospora sp. NPDC048194 TaxID=3364045 RepID=UPI0037146485